MGKIELDLSLGQKTIIDKDLPKDLEWILKVSWYAHKSRCSYYARNRKYGFLHRIINNTDKELQTDHRNGNTLDNRADNLRALTPKENIEAYHERNN